MGRRKEGRRGRGDLPMYECWDSEWLSVVTSHH